MPRRFRNPRYAPETLERKLHPSGLAGIPVTAEILIPTTSTATTSSDAPLMTADYSSVPGDPVPPPPPSGGTGPAPPPGDGTPPQGPPSIPSGPGEPN